MSRRREWVAITVVLLVAAAFRFVALGEVPPGLSHDEVFNRLIAHDILDGKHAIYFTKAYGHEPLFHYFQAATVALFGDHWLGVRWPAAAFGVLGVAVVYLLVRHLFSVNVALLSSSWVAVTFWPLFFARVGLRAIMLPVTGGLAVYFFFRGLEQERVWRPWLLAGAMWGVSTYTYMAARILPAIFVCMVGYFFVFDRRIRVNWHGVVMMFLVAALISAPLVIWLAANPGAEHRVAEVRDPLNQLAEGDPSGIWEGLVANAKFFTVSGDIWARENIPFRPVFPDPLNGALFLIGVALVVWRWREVRFGWMIIWLIGSLGPSVATQAPPSSIRDILAVLVTFVFSALAVDRGLAWLHERGLQSKAALGLLAVLPLVVTGALTVRDYFFVWPEIEGARFTYQEDMTDVARRLNSVPEDAGVAVAGLSVDSLDRPTLEVNSRRRVDDVRLCDTRETLVVPAGEDGWLFVPNVVPFDGDLRDRFLTLGAPVEIVEQANFTAYAFQPVGDVVDGVERLERNAALPEGGAIQLPASFDGQLAYEGLEWLQLPVADIPSFALLSYWRVETPSASALKVFVHVIDEQGQLVTQDDGLRSTPEGWAAGDLVIQKHVFPLSSPLPAGAYRLEIGVYEPRANRRLPVAGTDRLVGAMFEVEE